ncbi:MAG: hypothetical protein U1E87_01045 [Alphaproteobacteria bacterium]
MADNSSDSAPRGIGLGYIIYRQVAGVLGAFALAVFLAHFVQLDWRGALAYLINMWGEYVRPVVKWLVDSTLVALLRRLFGWQIHVPTIAHDYAAVGLVMSLSALRANSWRLQRRKERGQIRPDDPYAQSRWTPYILVTFVLSTLLYALTWPLSVLARVHYTVTSWNQHDNFSRASEILYYAPLVYFTLLLAANYLLLKPDT